MFSQIIPEKDQVSYSIPRFSLVYKTRSYASRELIPYTWYIYPALHKYLLLYMWTCLHDYFKILKRTFLNWVSLNCVLKMDPMMSCCRCSKHWCFYSLFMIISSVWLSQDNTYLLSITKTVFINKHNITIIFYIHISDFMSYWDLLVILKQTLQNYKKISVMFHE